MNIVLDTNVLISGLLIPEGKPGQIVQLVAAGYIKLCYDSRIIAEYFNVMSRKKFGFNKDDIQDLLLQIKHEGILITPKPIDLELPDEEDKKFIEVALSSNAKYIVTGNTKHFPKNSYKNIKIITPAEFILLI